MKFLVDKKNLKIISLILVIITITNLIIPICSYAKKEDPDTSFGGSLFKPIAKLICGIGDAVIMVLQRMFLGYWDIKDPYNEENEYSILYSPGAIFSNQIPALNADFFGTTEKNKKVKVTYEKKDYKSVVDALNMNNATVVREKSRYALGRIL